MNCHTCGGKGHFRRHCPNRKVMIINEDKEYETGDEVDPNAPEDEDYDSDGVDAYPSEARTIVVSQRALNVLPSASTQHCSLFQTKALVGHDKACKVIIDGGSCRNLATKELCTKLKLKYLPHPHPYYIQWLSDNGEMKVNHMVRVEFAIGPYEEETSIARGGEEQLDQRLDVKLDMELDLKTSHGCAREEREACARGGGEVQENKNSADIITWREYEALRNEMRREFRTPIDELKGTVQGLSQKLDTTCETVTTMKDQMTDIQRNLADMRLAIENLTQQQQEDDDDPKLQDDARNARGVKTVDEYHMEMEMLMQRGRVKESLEMTMTRFLNGLKYDIKGIVRHYSYTTMNELLHHAREAESQLADEAKIKGQASGVGRYTPRAPPTTAPAPSTRSAPYSTPPSKPVSNVSNTKKSESAARITCWRFDGSLWREKTLLMLADHFYWPKMRRDVDRVNMEASKRVDFVRKIHVKTKELIEKKGKSNAARMNKKRKEMLFKPGDMVWVHFRKDRFPKLRKSKLLPRGAGPYKVLAKINDNAYSIDLPHDEFGVSNSFMLLI
ncbi:hypothetical protein QYE76_027382 [Lolium multiflorum]|uniref:CCHC-type domain-containing protein n=1 Tax=Lolium multiflorum TaxID=4521 RepID=A0AAD8VEW4_LOLMU|nr:hypothetical protein QYE76_027382 [Lolium multiflorum]